MKNFIKGIAGGIGNIVPGLSGSALLVIFGIYDSCLNAINNIIKLKDIKKNILFLLPIVLGIVLGTIILGKILVFFLKKNAMITSYAFFGFIVGTIPLLFKEANNKGFKRRYLISFIVALVIGFLLLTLENYQVKQVDNLNFFQGVELGLVLAFSTIIPGISGTVLLTLMGFYDFYLNAVANVNIITLLPAGIGYLIGAVIFSMLMSALLKKYYGFTYYAITGFVIATIPAILRGNLGLNIESVLSTSVLVITFIVTNNLSKIKS